MPIKYIDDVPNEELFQKRVFLRLDLNVPLDESGQVADASKIESSLPTIRRLLRANAKIIIASHLGQPKGKIRSPLSLKNVASYLRDLLDNEIFFVHDSIGHGVIKLIDERKPGEIIFLENLRFNPGEENDDPVFAKMLARLGDIYVNDAFATLHRPHASVHGIVPYFPQKSYGGLLLKKELTNLDKILKHPEKPLVLIIGAAKINSKIGIIYNLLKKVDYVLIGGAMAYTFLYAEGKDVGTSLKEDDKVSLAQSLLKKAQDLQVKVLLPSDHIVADSDKSDNSIRVINNGEFLPKELGFDIGPKTIERFKSIIECAGSIFWNGPMGMFEDDRFFVGTKEIAQAVSRSKAFSVVGGGDSVLAIKKAGVLDKISYVSTGGGASLELLSGKELLGLKALGYYDV